MKPKDQRRAEGAERNEKWAALTPEQQLEHLDRGGFRALKQRTQIAKKLEAPNAV